ncbi:hypothetical protein B0T16DRAFT_420534 [Cercophora newfieldiana]|uniref:Uncharacterized protein n=1 Tax=Cercophora newfieldiana TaxID=92897 RepID=A0AA39XX06_9PEZI|nr:hypothetical protein B0T16DRAFT_420534 [Cercophora newfieldiana]
MKFLTIIALTFTALTTATPIAPRTPGEECWPLSCDWDDCVNNKICFKKLAVRYTDMMQARQATAKVEARAPGEECWPLSCDWDDCVNNKICFKKLAVRYTEARNAGREIQVEAEEI